MTEYKGISKVVGVLGYFTKIGEKYIITEYDMGTSMITGLSISNAGFTHTMYIGDKNVDDLVWLQQ